MGYATRVTGEIKIQPPLSWLQVKPIVERRDFDLKIRVVERVTDTEDGQMIQKQGVSVIPLSEDGYTSYAVKEHLQLLVDLFPAHEFVGYLEGEGEEQGDVWRLTVSPSRVAVMIEPRIVWPDDEAAAPQDVYSLDAIGEAWCDVAIAMGLSIPAAKEIGGKLLDRLKKRSSR